LPVKQAKKEKVATCLHNVCGMHVNGCVQVTATLSLRNKTNLCMLCGWGEDAIFRLDGVTRHDSILRVSHRGSHIISRKWPELSHLILMIVT